MEDELILLVSDAYKEVLQLQSQNINFEKPEKIDKDTLIYGSEGYLDSLGLVSLVVALEERVKKKFNVSISLFDAEAMSGIKDPFRNVEALSLYIKGLVNKKKDI